MNKFTFKSALCEICNDEIRKRIFIIAEINEAKEYWSFDPPPINWGHPWYFVKNVKIHEDYESKTKSNDIALVTIDTKETWEDPWLDFRIDPVEELAKDNSNYHLSKILKINSLE